MPILTTEERNALKKQWTELSEQIAELKKAQRDIQYKIQHDTLERAKERHPELKEGDKVKVTYYRFGNPISEVLYFKEFALHFEAPILTCYKVKKDGKASKLTTDFFDFDIKNIEKVSE